MENSELSSSMLEDEAQLAPGCSMSYGALVQQSSAILQNECLILEANIEKLTREVDRKEKLCARQAENIAKQQSDLEHYKIKTHNEEMQNKSHISKIRSLREKLQVLDKYFDNWGKIINPMLGYKNDLEEMIKQLKVRQEVEEALLERLEEENKYYKEEANKEFLTLQECKDKEYAELSELKSHLSNQLEQRKQQEKELEEVLNGLQHECREKKIMIEILEPQRTELKKTLERLTTEVAVEKEEMSFTSNQLETLLQQESISNKQLLIEIETVDQKINEINNNLREKEAEIKILDSKQKQLNAVEEEYDKVIQNEQQELHELELSVEGLTSQFSACMKIETENITLKAICDDLQNETNDHQKKIAEVESNEKMYIKKIEELNKCIKEIEIEKEDNVCKLSVIENKIKKLEKEQEDNEKEHKDLSLKIDKKSAELQDENNQLIASLHDLSEKLSDEKETKHQFEKSMKDLETELAQATALLQESEIQRFSIHEKSNSVNKHYIEEIQILDETLKRSIEDYEKAVSDCKQNEDVKKEVQKLEIDLENNRENYAQTIQELQASYATEIENKSKLMAEARAQCEQEYRSKEAMKTDALVELKEIKGRIIELEKQNAMIEKEIVAKADLLKKCDNLLQRMMNKFNKVAQEAMKSSLSVAGVASQQASVFVTPKSQRKPVKVASPGSDSSGKTFNPDKVDSKKIIHKRQPFRPLPSQTNLQNMSKKKTVPEPPKRKPAPSQNDDWGSLFRGDC